MSPSTERRTAERGARRQFILEAARGLLDEQPIEEIRMDDIAAAAGYTRRTLYSYFGNRDEIWLRVHLADLAERWSLQRNALRGVDGAPARIRIFAETLFAFWKEHPTGRRVEQYFDFHGIDPDLFDAELFREFEGLNNDLANGLREIFRAGMEDGSLRADLQLDACISQFLHCLRAVLGRALSSGFSFAEVDPDQYVQQFLNLFLRGIRRDE